MAGPTQEQPKWYTLTPEAVAQQLKVDPAKGLSAAEAQQRLQQYGPNQMAAKKKESGLQAFLRQYQDFMQIILVGAAVVSLIVTRDVATTLVLLALTVFTFLPVELGFPRFLGLTSRNGNQWLICIGLAIAYLLIDEVVKVFMRARRRSHEAEQSAPAVAASASA